MSELALLLEEYLATRRALGNRLELPARLLKRFVAFAVHHETPFITTECALQWATEPRDAQPAQWASRLGMVRRFARYAHAVDPRHEVPPQGLLPQRYRRRQPYLYRDTEIAELIAAAHELSGTTGPLTRFGVRYRLKKHLAASAAVAPTLNDKRLHPHSLRHTTAVQLLKADVHFATISQWIGHGIEPVACGRIQFPEVGDVESGEEVFLHVADAGLDAALLVSGADVARFDFEAVMAGEVGVAGVEHRRLPDRALQHRGLQIVDHDARGNACGEELEGIEVAAEEVLHGLGDGELDVHQAAVAQDRASSRSERNFGTKKLRRRRVLPTGTEP